MPNPKRRRKMVTNNRKAQISRHSKNIFSFSLNEIEDQNDIAFWNEVTRDAALKAINENKALNIPVTLLENGWVVRKFNDGIIEKIKKIEKKASTAKLHSLTKGAILQIKSN